MRSPLALLKVRHRTGFAWRVLFSLCGLGEKKAQSIVLLREPTEEEKEALEECLLPGDHLRNLDMLLVQDMSRRKKGDYSPL